MIFKSRSSFIKVALTLLSVLAVYACQKSDDLPDREISHITFLNLLPDSVPPKRPDLRSGVDFYIKDQLGNDGQEQLVNVTPFLYRQGTSRYIDVVSNNVEITFKRNFKDSTLVTDTIPMGKDQFYSVFLGRVTRRASLGDSIFTMVAQDNLTQTSVAQNAKVRFAFLSQDMPIVDVNAKLIIGETSRKDSVIFTGGRFKSVSPFTEIRSQRVAFQFKSSRSGNRLVDTVELQAGKMYTYTVYGGWSAVDSTKSSINVVETINR